MIKFPKKIRIVSSVYALKRIELSKNFGEFDSNNREIAIDTGLCEGRVGYFLLHEVLHGVLHEYGFALPEEEEERIVNAITGGLAGLAKDHSKLLIDVIKNLKEA